MTRANRFDQILGMGMLAALVIGCFMVLLPFVTALLMAAILTYSTWPVNVRLREAVGGRKTLAAGLMMLGACVLLVAPFVFVAMSLADSIAELVEASRRAFEHGPPQAPAWLTGLPLVGDTLASYWDTLTHDSTRLLDDLRGLIAPAQSVLLAGGSLLFAGLLQLGLSVLVAFFLYRDGEAAAARVVRMATRIGGARGMRLLHVAGNTVLAVVYGILGTALAQGLVAGIGFVIAGVPGAALLGLITFFLSVVPVGPPLVWVPAALWLFSFGSTGWAIFLAVWGVLGISMVDNVLKPIIISKGTNLPFMLGFLGVLGGVATLGFIGIFIGPTLLAVGYQMFNTWVDSEELAAKAAVAGARAEAPATQVVEEVANLEPVSENDRFRALSKE
jgi:predicted PurR-regulated permease PerM